MSGWQRSSHSGKLTRRRGPPRLLPPSPTLSPSPPTRPHQCTPASLMESCTAGSNTYSMPPSLSSRASRIARGRHRWLTTALAAPSSRSACWISRPLYQDRKKRPYSVCACGGGWGAGRQAGGERRRGVTAAHDAGGYAAAAQWRHPRHATAAQEGQQGVRRGAGSQRGGGAPESQLPP